MLGKRITKKIIIAGCFLTMVMFAGCGSDTTKVNEGMKLIEELDYQGALACFAEAAELSENPRLIARGKGIAYMGMADYAQAVESFQEALAASNGFLEPIDYDLNYYLAAAYTKNAMYAEARASYDAILALRPKEKDCYFLRGIVLLQLGEFEQAKADFDEVIKLDGKNYDRLIQIYQALEATGHEDTGKEYLQNVLAGTEKQIKAYDRGRIYYYLGEYQKAYIALEEARKDGGAEGTLYLGKAYEATGDYNYASSVYSSYLANDSSNAEIYNQLGLCELKKENYAKALEAFLAGKQIEDNSVMQSLFFNEIVAYEYMGEFEKAATLLDAYLKLYPDDENAKREQQFLQTR